jgi:RNA polymerase primary sigma factor
MPKHSVMGRVKPLSGIGKDPDQLHYDELNGPLTVDSENLSTLFPSFKEHAIEGVAGGASDGATTNQKNTEDPAEVGAAEEAEESSEENEKEIDLTPGALSRIDDPVRLYLNEMASVSLLTREGEIELAKRIEDGKHELAFAIAGMPMTLLYWMPCVSR